MRRIKTLFLRGLLLNKRLLKKISFVLILCLIPILTLSMTLLSNDESGILTILLCCEDPTDTLALEKTAEILEKESIISFSICDSVEEGRKAIENGKADACWIFNKNLSVGIENYSKNNEPFITVIERSTDISLQLSHERLYGSVFPEVSFSIFKEFMLSKIFSPDEITEKDLKEAYDNAIGGGDLLEFETLDGQSASPTGNYLTAPLRGILSIMITLCGLAATMYHQSDVKNGIYDWMPSSKRVIPHILTVSGAVTDSALVVLFSLICSGLFGNVFIELAAMLAFIISTTAFCVLIGTLTRKSARTGQIIPFVIIILLVMSPIFFNLDMLLSVQLLLPNYYYLCIPNQPSLVVNSFIYSMILFAVTILLNKLSTKQA